MCLHFVQILDKVGYVNHKTLDLLKGLLDGAHIVMRKSIVSKENGHIYDSNWEIPG